MLAEFMVGFSVIMVLKGAVVRVIFVLGISCQCVLTDFENAWLYPRFFQTKSCHFLFRINSGVGEMALLLTCLPSKQDYLGLFTLIHVEDLVVHACNPILSGLEKKFPGVPGQPT